MVHGLAANLAFWYSLGSIFSATHRVTLCDLRGHGRSSMPNSGYTPAQMAEDLKEMIDALEIKHVTLVGHSFGGEVVLHFALRYPEFVDRIILADARLKLFQPQQKISDWPHWHELKPQLIALGISIDADEPEAGYRLLTELAKLQAHPPSEDLNLPTDLAPFNGGKRMAERWLKLIQTTQALEDLMSGVNLSLEEYKHLQKPTLLLYGDRSPTLPTVHNLQSIWPHAQVEIIPKAGHFFPVSKPDLFATLTQSWLFQTNH